jgi:hypothetical protein
MSSKSLAVSPAQGGVIQAFDKMVSQACGVVSAAQRAPDIGRKFDKTLGRIVFTVPKGMTPREARIATDALESSRNAPLYLTEAYRMRETAHKIAAGLGGDSAPKLVHHVVHTVAAKTYERVQVGKTIDATFEESKKE